MCVYGKREEEREREETKEEGKREGREEGIKRRNRWREGRVCELSKKIKVT